MKKLVLLSLFSCLTLLASADGIQIVEAQGWLESAYVKFGLVEGAKSYHAYIKGGQFGDFTKMDDQLVRNYGSYGRADMVGLQAGTYEMKIVPVDAEGAEMTAQAGSAANLEVVNYSREGFAFKDGYAPGAYNSDGTLKQGAKVFYVTKNTAKTISTTVTGAGSNPCVGLQAIIAGYEKGQDKTPIAFRFIGLVTKEDLDAIGSSEEGIQVKGRKADSELNMTFEGIGDDATIKGFGFLVRNSKGVEFRNIGIMRCMDDGISLDTDNSNIWVHHNDVFYGPNGGGDHAKGDGAVDVKSDSKLVTVSYNRYWDTGKTNMFGMKSESGPNYVSYDHNWFDHSDSRHPRVRTMSVHVYNNYFDGIQAQLALDEDEGGKYTDVSDSVVLAMQNSGCTFEETVQMLRQGQMPPVPKFLSTGSMRLKDFDGTVNGGRDLIGGDLNRPDFCYRFKSNLEKPLLAPGPQQPGFGFKFPDEGKFFTNASEQGKANITRVADKVVAMCGSVHVAQSNAVMTMLSQSGLSNLRGGLPQIGVTSNEHAPVDYTITKNDETGDITIKYTSPEALPFKFEWTATVDISGNVTTTPMTVEMKAAGAENAAARMNVNLTDAQKAKADTLIADLGSKHNLTGKKLDMFSNFVVSLKLTDASAAKDLDVASDMAKNIAAWDTFELGKGSVPGITDALTTTFNELIDEAMDDAAKGPGASSKFSNDRDVSQDMYTDAHRLNFSFNGTSVKCDPGSPQKVIDAFKKTVANPAMRRGLSSILHQTAILAFTSLSNRATLPSTTQHKTGIDSKNLQGIEKMVSRDAGSGKYSMMTTDKKEGEPIRYDLTVSEDGKSATLTVSEKSNLVTGAGRNDMAVYGTVKNTMSFQIDLTGEKPVIVSTSIGQDFAAA